MGVAAARPGVFGETSVESTGRESWRGLAELTANRLRLVQADLADESASSRREQLAEEVRAALEKVLPAERNAFIEAVEERFPGWEGGRVVTYGEGSGGGAAAAPTDIAELKDPGFLVRQLVKAAEGMSESDRRAAGERLAAAGIAPAGVGEIPAESVARVKAAVQVEAGRDVQAGRMLDALALIAEQVISLDKLVSTTWSQMSPGSGQRRRQALGSVLGKYLTGSDEVGREQVAADLGRFRQLTAAMLASIAQAGEQAYRQMARLSPDQVEALAKAEKKWNESVEFACWRKYQELAGSVDPATVESEVIRAMATFAEGLMR